MACLWRLLRRYNGNAATAGIALGQLEELYWHIRIILCNIIDDSIVQLAVGTALRQRWVQSGIMATIADTAGPSGRVSIFPAGGELLVRAH